MKFKKLVACLLTVAMLTGIMTFSVFADETVENNTVEIANANDLKQFSEMSQTSNYKGKTVILTNDIDMSDITDWTPIGKTTKFSGTFDGQGHTIRNFTSKSNGYNIVNGSGYCNAFFGNLSGATVKNVTFDNARVECAEDSNYGNVFGIVAAYSYGDVFENVTVDNSYIRGFGKVGGMLGMAANQSAQTTVKNCTVSNTKICGTYDAGGIIGLGQGTIVMSGCKVSNNTYVSDPEYNYELIETEIACDGSNRFCAGSNTKIKGNYWVYGEYYYAGYADFYTHYGNSSHDCDLKDTNMKLANSEVIFDAVAEVNGFKYLTLSDAIAAASDGDTIKLGEGTFTTYGNTSPRKSLTFVGAESGKTSWIIGAAVPDPSNIGTEYNADYSFDGCDSITFNNITLNAGATPYLGFVRVNNFKTEDCVVNGQLSYAGNVTSSYINTTFNAPQNDYSIWCCSPSESMTFDGCTFNGDGKFINIYKDYSAGTNDVTITFKDNTVISTTPNKSVLNVKDANNAYTINILGTNTVTGLDKNSNTGSDIFQLETLENSQDVNSTVTINNVEVYNKNRSNERLAAYVKYDLNGGVAAENVDYSDFAVTINEEITLPVPPVRDGYYFTRWNDGTNIYGHSAKVTITGDVTFTAEWAQISNSTGRRDNNSYNISFNTNGGSKIANQKVSENGCLTEPKKPTKAGYDFDGWYTDSEFKNEYDFDAKVTSSFTLYAKWSEQDNSKHQIVLTIGKKDALVYGTTKANDVAPKIVNDRTMLPARFVAESLGATVDWNEEEEKVTIKGKNIKTGENVVIVITIDSDIATVNSKEIKLDSPAFIEYDRTYTPLRFISEQLGASVEWDETTQKVIITVN